MRLNLTARQVEELSAAIASAEENPEYALTHARLIQIESGESTPSIFKLCSLAAIYGRQITELLAMFVDFDRLEEHRLQLAAPSTKPVTFDESADERTAVPFPIRFDPGYRLSETTVISRMIELWGEIPGVALRGLSRRDITYGYIGLEDYTMYPLLRPGSFVQIDTRQRRVRTGPFRTEYDRPIYFLELREGYICAWCELQDDRLLAIPHPLSGRRIREFRFPDEADIAGRVTGVTTRITGQEAAAVQPIEPLLP